MTTEPENEPQEEPGVVSTDDLRACIDALLAMRAQHDNITISRDDHRRFLVLHRLISHTLAQVHAALILIDRDMRRRAGGAR